MKYNEIYKDVQYKRPLTSYNGKSLEPSRGPERKELWMVC